MISHILPSSFSPLFCCFQLGAFRLHPSRSLPFTYTPSLSLRLFVSRSSLDLSLTPLIVSFLLPVTDLVSHFFLLRTFLPHYI